MDHGTGRAYRRNGARPSRYSPRMVALTRNNSADIAPNRCERGKEFLRTAERREQDAKQPLELERQPLADRRGQPSASAFRPAGRDLVDGSRAPPVPVDDRASFSATSRFGSA